MSGCGRSCSIAGLLSNLRQLLLADVGEGQALPRVRKRKVVVKSAYNDSDIIPGLKFKGKCRVKLSCEVVKWLATYHAETA